MVAEGLGTFVAVRCEIPIMFTMGLGLFLVGALGFLVGLPLDIACPHPVGGNHELPVPLRDLVHGGLRRARAGGRVLRAPYPHRGP